MSELTRLGAKVRALRRREKLTQAQMADRLGVSPSYLNLIENNRRPLTAALLLRLAQEFQLDLASFSPNDDARLVSDLREVFGDPMFEASGVTAADLADLSASQPSVARAVLTLYRGYKSARESVETVADQLEQQGQGVARLSESPNEEVHDLVQRHSNYFPEIERAAEALWADAKLDSEDVYGGLIDFLRKRYAIEVRTVHASEGQAMRRFDDERGLVTLSEVLPPRSRRFQLAHQVGLIHCRAILAKLGEDEALSSDSSRALATVVAANYFAAAALMPYEPFARAARESRYDIELLAHRYGASFEQVCHRLTTLRRPGNEGIPLHFIRIDIAGNISKRFSGSGIRMPRFSGACPRWNVHAAFLTPGMFRVQLSRMSDGAVYFCIARTVRRDSGGYNMPHTVHSIGVGCEVRHARAMVYSDGVDLDNVTAATPVGVTCRTCEQADCEQRVLPPMTQPLEIDENVRGVSFYSPTQ